MKVMLEIHFTESYGGTEFPPASTRLLQAIIAGSADTYVNLLKHLETRIPVIYASSDVSILQFAKYVPNNDNNLTHKNAKGQRKYITRRSDTGLRVVYEYDIDEQFFDDLQGAAKTIHTLGIGGDFVVANAKKECDVTGLDKYEMKEGGTIRLFTPVHGFIDSVFARYKTGAALRLRHSYFAKNDKTRNYALFELTEPVPSESISLLVSWIRHAASKYLPTISGHGDHDKRLVIIPAVTQDWRDNMIRRVAVLAPDARGAREAAAKMAALHLTDEVGKDCGYLVPAEFDAVFSDYFSASKVWRTVTPVVGAYDNGDQKQRMRNFARMFKHSNLPMPRRIKFVPRQSKHFVNAYHKAFPRFFVECEFDEPIAGPITLGRGRYAGLGIFASVNR